MVRRRAAGREGIEFAVGLLVLLVLAAGLLAAVLGSGRSRPDGYALTARFDHIDGLDVGSPVKLAGVEVGRVTAERIDPKSFQAVVGFTVRDGIRLPDDSSGVITSDSLLGGKYLALSPGGADHDLLPGARLQITQGSISLEQLLSKFIFSVTDAMSAAKKGGGPAPASSSTPSAASSSAPGP
ncbi:MAG: outer membrane lipid asymmetry maintenance protein MlaD [Gluconacetobacter diazotrophicus]|nr:outer membrane lipid asymmetry maintenance protein MlaD [Gluconacetobacter diazotrophicus]